MPTDIYVGYMDEEVASLLTFMLKNKKAHRIDVIDRGFFKKASVETDSFLERPVSTYLQAVSSQGAYGYGNVSVSYDTIGHLLESKSGKNDYLKYLEERVLRRRFDNAPMKVDSDLFSAVCFDNIPAGIGDDPQRVERAIIIRAAEMGKQPALVRLYLRLLIRYLTKQRSIDDVSIYSYAAGGGILATYDADGTKARPGKLWDIKGSVFVGPDSDDLGQKFANVEMIYLSKGDPIQFSRTAFLAQGSYDSLVRRSEAIFFNKTPYEMIDAALTKAGADTLPALENGVSVSFSYFDGTDTKTMVDATYNKPAKKFMVNSNMEDYHLLRVLNSMTKEDRSSKNYPNLNRFKIVRVDTNIRASEQISAKVTTYIDSKMCETSLTPDEYGKLVAWGRNGCAITKEAIDELPAKAKYWHKDNDDVRWSRCNLDAKKECKQLLVFEFNGQNQPILSANAYIQDKADEGYTGGYKDESFCLNPFCVEIATDFKSDLPGSEKKLWLRGNNKWKGLKSQGFIDSPGIDELATAKVKAIMKKESNIDRILYKSSGTAALQICVGDAWTKLHS